ncbi:MAG: hypothetical protein HY000_35430 [Planctomycetes bacterium]|nr:hypothetical protein [Planctomycetota bacterium]
MKTTLSEAMTSGVFVEVRDAQGNCLGQAVYTDWKSRPLPAVGDTMCCVVWVAAEGRKQKVHGRVCSRHFEVQKQPDGQPCVWAQLVLERIESRRRPGSAHVEPRSLRGFSRN